MVTDRFFRALLDLESECGIEIVLDQAKIKERFELYMEGRKSKNFEQQTKAEDRFDKLAKVVAAKAEHHRIGRAKRALQFAASCGVTIGAKVFEKIDSAFFPFAPSDADVYTKYLEPCVVEKVGRLLLRSFADDGVQQSNKKYTKLKTLLKQKVAAAVEKDAELKKKLITVTRNRNDAHMAFVANFVFERLIEAVNSAGARHVMQYHVPVFSVSEWGGDGVIPDSNLRRVVRTVVEKFGKRYFGAPLGGPRVARPMEERLSGESSADDLELEVEQELPVLEQNVDDVKVEDISNLDFSQLAVFDTLMQTVDRAPTAQPPTPRYGCIFMSVR